MCHLNTYTVKTFSFCVEWETTIREYCKSQWWEWWGRGIQSRSGILNIRLFASFIQTLKHSNISFFLQTSALQVSPTNQSNLVVYRMSVNGLTLSFLNTLSFPCLTEIRWNEDTRTLIPFWHPIEVNEQGSEGVEEKAHSISPPYFE